MPDDLTFVPKAAELHTASLLVHVNPDKRDAVHGLISAMPGAEIHAEQGGKLVVTVEGPNEGWIADRMTAMHLLDGVLSAVLVFHHVETLDAAPPAAPRDI
ncbi:chaperone NapD [Azospirillum sp. SYSU D00513]|uniref:chaperone NapD n=1 Tax=Azospirillum sp. SYSU D00513 TaxID=2812561 RepID=UPI001A973987|nr:chaperone NapD [Azospirillum sp. SYSU D00513]